jgi:hypothetical protein
MLRKLFSFLSKRFSQSSRKRQVAICVWGLHLVILLTLLIHHAAIRSFKPSRPIAIRTFAPQKTIVQAPKKAASAPKSTSPQKTSAPKPAANKKTAPPAAPKTAKSKNSATKTIPTKDRSLDDLAAALNAVDLSEKPTIAKRAGIDVPALIQVQQQNVRETSAPSYSEFLIAYLQESLDLPEYGEVKIKLTINREGNLLDSAVLASENPKNSEFLKNRLPELTFPCFNDFGVDEKNLTFTISFRNAENLR